MQFRPISPRRDWYIKAFRAHKDDMTQHNILSRRQALALATAGFAAAATSTTAHAKTPRPPVLVELFTSQGCSSCPPADKIAAQLHKRSDVIILSYNVDYWDYLGWRDTLAKPEFSQRQYDYARTRGDGSVYTPQMIFNGNAHVVGSQKSAVNTAIADAETAPIEMQLNQHNQELTVTIPAFEKNVEATLWLLAVAATKTQVIGRGENAGETITYHNVVRNMVPAAMWNGEAYTGKWMRKAVFTSDSTNCIAVLQVGKTGKLLAIAQI
jgi:hypothetical protein